MKIRTLLLTCAALALSACSAQQEAKPVVPSAEVLFDGPIDALAPFRHGNRYLYMVASPADGEREVESRCSIAGDRIFVTVNQNVTVLARTEMLSEGSEIKVVSEVSPQHDIAFTYDPPLSVLSAPLRKGIQRSTAAIRAWRPSDGSTVAEGTVEVAWSAHPAPEEMTDASFEIRSVKKIDLSNGRKVKIQSKRWIAPGIGEIGSSGSVGDDKIEFRELVCAHIGDDSFGSCGTPIQRIQP